MIYFAFFNFISWFKVNMLQKKYFHRNSKFYKWNFYFSIVFFFLNNNSFSNNFHNTLFKQNKI